MVGSAELGDLGVGASRKPTKAMEFSPHHGILEIFRSFYGIFRGETGDF